MVDQPRPQRGESVLALANERLLALRRQRRQARVEQGEALYCDGDGRRIQEGAPPDGATALARMALHLQQQRRQPPTATGGGPSALFAPLRRLATAARATDAQVLPNAQKSAENRPPSAAAENQTSFEAAHPCVRAAAVRVYPSLLSALIKRGLTCAGRVWLLAHYIDTDGRGWLRQSTLRERLSGSQSPMRIGGKRRLRQLLGDGEGLLWQRDRFGRIWLYSASRVARGLDVERLAGRPVLLPLSELLGSAADVRAGFYAGFHAGREPSPISRAAIRAATGVPERTQRRYDRRAAIVAKFNLTISQLYTPERYREYVYRYGRGCFVYVDAQGRVGRPGGRYLARRLPNSYTTRLERAAGGRQRTINRRIRADSQRQADLVKTVAQGNGCRRDRQTTQRRYFTRARRLADQPTGDAYWQDPLRPTVWYHRPPP